MVRARLFGDLSDGAAAVAPDFLLRFDGVEEQVGGGGAVRVGHLIALDYGPGFRLTAGPVAAPT